MSPRRRSNRKASWPANLYETAGYFTYRNPRTGERFGLGRDRRYALEQAIEANLHLAGHLKRERLIDRMLDDKSRTVGAWFQKFETILAERKLAPHTRAMYRTRTHQAVTLLGADTRLRAVTPLQISEGLESIAPKHPRAAKALLGFMRDSFRAAIEKGWLAAGKNPAQDVRSAGGPVRRSRLTLEVFCRVRTAAEPWLRAAMMLALVSGQRREDIASAQFKDVREGHWWLRQGKTGARLMLPLTLRLGAAGASLEDVVRQCRQSGAVSQYLIHRRGQRAGRPINRDMLSRGFSEALATLKLQWGERTPPTFHEIRSLAARLYREQGNVNVRELLGHRSESTSLLYQDGRGEWVKVRVTV